MPDERLAAELIAAELPSLRGLPVARSGAGTDHELFTAGEDWLVRFPSGPDRVPWLEREVRIMAAVSGALGDRVPGLELIGSGGPRFPYPFVAYRRVPGVAADRSPVLDRPALALELGRLLTRLHAVAVAGVPPTPAGGERLTPAAVRDDLIAHAGSLPALLVTSPSLAERARPYLAGAVPPPRRTALTRLIHNDICPEHVLVDPETGRLRGLIDFTDALVGDPVLDFVGLVGLGRPFVDAVLAGYGLPLGDAFAATFDWFARMLSLTWLARAVAAGHPGEVDKHLRWVEHAFALGRDSGSDSDRAGDSDRGS